MSDNPWFHRASRYAPLVVFTALLSSCGTTEEDAAPCIDDADYFADTVFPEVVQSNCIACHTADGVARDSDLLFVSAARPDHLAVNEATLRNVAGLQRDDESIILRKPRGDDDHGGGKVLSTEDSAYAVLEEFVRRVDEPVSCAGEQEVVDPDAGLTLSSPLMTLRKATLLLEGRLPTIEETERVRAGGRDALVDALWATMATDTFADRMMELLNDVFLTDRYTLGSTDAIGIFDDDRFPVYWYEDYSDDDYYALRRATNDAIAREPLALVGHVIRNDLPWTELLLADYTMVNTFSAQAYGIQGVPYPDLRDPASLEYFPATVPDYSHAGMLTTPAFLNRWPTTATNRNRKRAWFFFKTFLSTDILTFADRPIDPTVTETHNPTLNDAQCTVCHATMDPVAGAFQNWDDEGRYAPLEEGWYAEMAPPGFGDVEMPSTDRATALQWLGQQATDDPRFAVGAVRLMLHKLTGIELLDAMLAGDDPAKIEALNQQEAWIEEVAHEFRERQHDIKYVVEQVVLSRYFRAVADAGATPGALHHAGTAHMLTPEEFDRKIVTTLGFPWRTRHDRENLLLDDFNTLYGGIDSFSIIDRLSAPNGVTAAIAQRMATEMSCEVVPRDFILPPEQRRLFPYVEPTWAPETIDGFSIPEVENRIRENIRWLHYRLLGEDLAPGSEEENLTYALFYETWLEGRDAVIDDTLDDRLPYDCRATTDFWTGENLPDELELIDDDAYLVRAWMTVLAYLLTDYSYLYE